MEKVSNNHYILILCGGTGPRLWPMSRADNPKQFLKIFNNVSLLEQTLFRSLKLVQSDHIFIVSNKNYQSKIENIVGNLIPKNNLFFEPLKKNTAMAIIYASTQIQKINPNAVISIFPSDHFIDNLKKFEQNIADSVSIANNENSIVTFGIKPISVNPSFGYIITKDKIKNFLTVNKFIEKPKFKLAQKLIKENAFCNSGIYTFKISVLIEELKKYQPKYFRLFSKINKNENIENIYKSSPNLSIDKAISEKSKKLVMIPANFYWNDVGEWKSIYNQLKKNKFDLVNLTDKTKILEVNSRNCLVSSTETKLVGLVDVNNLAIIDTPDALLVCNIALDGSSRVKDIVSQIVSSKKNENYFLKSPKNV